MLIFDPGQIIVHGTVPAGPKHGTHREHFEHREREDLHGLAVPSVVKGVPRLQERILRCRGRRSRHKTNQKARDLSPLTVVFTTGADERNLATGETRGAAPAGLLEILAAYSSQASSSQTLASRAEAATEVIRDAEDEEGADEMEANAHEDEDVEGGRVPGAKGGA